MRTRIALLIAALALGAAACGGDDSGGDAAATGACPGDAVTITMKDVKFDPKTATATVGQTICWVNEDAVEHDAVANSGATFKSELFGKGKTFSAKVDKAGTVEYECTIHPGMTGEITVK
jgi:plastocyanin